MEVFITDLTEMGGGNFCVAGWCEEQHRMIRPLPNGGNWSTALVEKFGVAPGSLMNFTATGEAHSGNFPHSTEDTRVNAAENTGLRLDLWEGTPKANSLQEAFAGSIDWNSEFQGRRQGVYVPVGTHCRSLWGIELDRNRLQFVEEFEKLKAVIYDGEGEYICAVSSSHLKTLWRDGGLIAAQQATAGANQVHVRLGLARAFGTHADKCFLMVNGIQF